MAKKKGSSRSPGIVDKLLRGSTVKGDCIVAGPKDRKDAGLVMYKAAVGPVPSGFLVAETCGTPHCINPDHLEVESYQEARPEPVVLPAEFVSLIPDKPKSLTPSSTVAVVRVRQKRMRSNIEIRNYIAGAMRQYSQSPVAMLNILTGYIAQLQDLMKRDHEDVMAETACAGHHPGRFPQGVYCKLCHDAEMAGKFGTIPGQPTKGGPDFMIGKEGEIDDAELLLQDLNIKPEG